MVSKRGAIRNIRIEKNLPDQICNMCDSQSSKPFSLALLIPKGREEFPNVLSRLTYPLISVSQTAKGIVTSNKQLMLYSSQISGTLCLLNTGRNTRCFDTGKHSKTKFAKSNKARKNFTKILQALFNFVKHNFKCLGIPWWQQEKMNYCRTAERTHACSDLSGADLVPNLCFNNRIIGS